MTTTRNTGKAKPVPTSWQLPIADYLAEQAAAGRPRQTIDLRWSHLTRTARAMRCAPAEVTTGSLIRWFKTEQQWSLETRRSVRTTLRSFFAWALEHGITQDNPALGLPRMKPVRAVARPAPDYAWKLALAGSGPRVRLMVRLAGEAGLRRAEIAQVHTRDLIEGPCGAELLVHGKGNKQRIVPLSDELAALIRAGAGGHTPNLPSKGFLFPGREDGHLSPRYVGKLIGAVLPDHWSTHTLRHRFATRAYRGTRNIRAVQQLLGHENVHTTERYTAVDDHEMRAAMMAAASPMVPRESLPL